MGAPRLIRDIVQELVDRDFDGNQSKFADHIEMTRGPVSRWLSGDDDPDHDSVRAIWTKYPELRLELQAAFELLPPKSRRKKAPVDLAVAQPLVAPLQKIVNRLGPKEVRELAAILHSVADSAAPWDSLKVCLGNGVELAEALPRPGQQGNGA